MNGLEFKKYDDSCNLCLTPFDVGLNFFKNNFNYLADDKIKACISIEYNSIEFNITML